MGRQTLDAGRPGREYSDEWWASVHGLYDECFPGLTAGIATAESIRVRWRDVTTPFTLFDGDRAVAHCGVLDLPMRLGGETVRVAGVHAVSTAADRRGEGLSRIVLAEALAWIDERFQTAKLNTDLERVYSGHGFRVAPTHRFLTEGSPAPDVSKRLLRPSEIPADARLLAKLFRERVPASDVCSGADSGWMATMVAALRGQSDSTFWLLEDYDAVVAFEAEEGRVLVTDVIAKEPPPLEVVLGASPESGASIAWTFSPDRFCSDFEPIPAPEAVGLFMVRGEWPVETAFGISPLWEH